MHNVTDPDSLRASVTNSLAENTDFQEALTAFPENSDAAPITDNTVLISMLYAMAECISVLEKRLDRAERKIRNKKDLPDDVIDQLASNVSPVKVFRKYRGMTQREIAKRAGCTTTYISLMEQKNRSASMQMLKRIAKILDVDVRELVEP